MPSVDNNRKEIIFNHLSFLFSCNDMSTLSSSPSPGVLLLAHIMLYHSTADEGLAISDLEVHVRLHPPPSEAGMGI